MTPFVEPESDLTAGGVGHDLVLLRDDDAGISGIALVGHENTLGVLSLLRVRHIDHHFRNGLIEHAAIEFQDEFIPQQIECHFLEVHVTPGLSPLRHDHGQAADQRRKEKDGMGEPQQTESRGAHRDEFLVERQAAEGRDGGDDAGDGQREDEKRGEQMREHFQDREKTDPFRHQQFHQSEELFGQHHETERSQADAKRREELPENIAIKDGVQHEGGRNPTSKSTISAL